MSSVEIIRYSTFSSTVVVGSNATVNADDAFRSHALIEGVRIFATSSTNFSVAIYTSSNKSLSNYVDSFTATNQFRTVWPASPSIYRDEDSTQLLHWSTTNKTTTSSITLTIYYQGG